ncbi:MAG: IS3 family transposase [Bacteroidia bacterium]|nr:IS3 family transposase [Bacteroidia bacterium]
MTTLRTKDGVSKIDVDTMCELFGKSRQAYYQRCKYNYKEAVKSEVLLQLVKNERKKMPKLGGRKLLEVLRPRIPAELDIGRDAFFDFLRENRLLVGKRKRSVRTTYSNHWLHKYPNLIRGYLPNASNQLWVSDITYIETASGFVYLNLVTDSYSRKIMGWWLGETLSAKHTVKALRMALNQLPEGPLDLIHHSDRGVQYCSSNYVKLLQDRGILISMTENGDPRENAIAERVNGILKDEWLNEMRLQSVFDVREQLKRIINTYNHLRPHSSLDMRTPEYVHDKPGTYPRRWKNYYTSKPVSLDMLTR